MNSKRLLLALLMMSLVLVSPGCESSDPVASDGSTIILSANPSNVPLGGLFRSTISAVVQSPSGVLLDGIQVIFTSEDGLLFEVGSEVAEAPLIVLTTNGVVSIELTTVETTTIRGQSGSASDEVTVTVAGQQAVGIVSLALLTNLGTPPTAQRGTTLMYRATVLDSDGRFFPGAEVVVDILLGSGLAAPVTGTTGGLATFDFDIENIDGNQLDVRVLAEGEPSNIISVTIQ